ncbi:MAG: hypothetical protein AAGJ81_11955 [Verrucomicrobiota bacterium]
MIQVRERFFRLSLRERTIAVALILGIGLFWGSSVLGGLRDAFERNGRVSAELEFQDTVLGRKSAIESEIAVRLEEMDAERSLSASTFVEIVDEIARGVGLSPDMDPVETLRGEMVSVHQLDLGFDDIQLVPLIDFIRRIENDGIPVSIEEMLLSVNERAPERLDIVLRLAGFEFDSGSPARSPAGLFASQ